MAKPLTPEEIAALPLSPADRMRLALHYGHDGEAAHKAMMGKPQPLTADETAAIGPAGTQAAFSSAQLAAASKPAPAPVAYAPAPKPVVYVAPTAAPAPQSSEAKMMKGMYIEPAWLQPKPLSGEERSSLFISPDQNAKLQAGPEVEDLGGDDRAPTVIEKQKDAAKAKAMGYSSPYAPAATPGDPNSADPMEKLKADFWAVDHQGGTAKAKPAKK